MSHTTSRLALGQIDGASDNVSAFPTAFNGNMSTLDGSVRTFEGMLTARSSVTPAYGDEYYATDVGQWAKYTGTGWDTVLAAGELKVTAASSAPAGWLMCDGSAISRSTYSALYNAVGTAYGSGDGSTTFNLPDYRGRTIVGAGSGSGLTSRTRGQSFGEENHQLTVAELASHSHNPDPGFTGFIEASSSPAPYGLASATSAPVQVSGPSATATAGSNTPHNNVQPSAVANVLIKT